MVNIRAESQVERTYELITGKQVLDVELVQQACKGGREAFDTLFLRHKHYIFNVCYRMTGSMEDACDACQMVFINAYKGIRKFKGKSAFRTWLYHIAVNVCVEMLNKRKKQRTFELIEPVDNRSNDKQERVREAILKLPPEMRAPLVLFYIQGLSGEELAQALGCTASAARVRLHRARHALKLKYEELEDEMQGPA